MANSWSIIIGGDPANGTVTFTPDLAGASAGQSLGVSFGDNVTWNNRTNCPLTMTAVTPAGLYLTEPVPPGSASNPILNVRQSITYTASLGAGHPALATQGHIAMVWNVTISGNPASGTVMLASTIPDNVKAAKGDYLAWVNQTNAQLSVTSVEPAGLFLASPMPPGTTSSPMLDLTQSFTYNVGVVGSANLITLQVTRQVTIGVA